MSGDLQSLPKLQRLPMQPIRDLLLGCAADRSDPATLALAGVIGAGLEQRGRTRLPLPGLDAAATRALLERWFPGAGRRLQLDWRALASFGAPEPRVDEIDDLAALLIEHADCSAGPPAAAREVAYALAAGCMGDNHLWQDLQLPSRTALSALIAHWFPALKALNHQDMKWKKFLYRQLCLREQIFICKSPSCRVCSDYQNCFGAEEGSAVSGDTARNA